MSEPERRGFRMPPTLALVFGLVAVAILLAWIVPSGSFDRVLQNGREVAVAGTYHEVPKHAPGLQMLLIAPLKGFQAGSELIIFLLVIGGAFQVLAETGAVETGIRKLAAYLAARPNLEGLFIPVMMSVFSLAGAVFGMSEEVIPFVLLFVPLARRLGYDALVGLSIPFLGAAAGFAAAFFNPFTVGIAQQLSGLPAFSGIGYRLITWVIGTAVVIAFVMRYAKKIKRDPSLSPIRDLEEAAEAVADHGDADPTTRQKAVLALFGLTMVVLVWGILKYQWFFTEIAALFLAMGLVLGIVGGLGADRICKAVVSGAKDMVSVALVVACAKALLIIAKDAHILDTMLHYAATGVSHLPRAVTAQMMFLTQATLNFFIHSGTSQAALTMPVMAPLADLTGITRQTAVYAFQLCEFVNPILPTSAVTMAVLGAAKLPWERWAKWFAPLMGILMVLCLLLLLPPVLLFRYE